MSHKLSPLSIVGLSLALVAMVFHVVGLATPSWVDVQMQFPGVGAITISYGLWVQCHDPGTCEHLSVDYLLHWQGDWMFACRVFSVAGLVLGVVGMVLEVLSLVVARCRKSKVLAVVTVLFMFAAGVSILTSALTFASNYHDTFTDIPRLNWSFAIDAMGGFAAVVAALMFLLSLLSREICNQ